MVCHMMANWREAKSDALLPNLKVISGRDGSGPANKNSRDLFLFSFFFLETGVSRLLVHPLADHFFSEIFGQVKHERWHHALLGIRISNGCTDSSPEQAVQLSEQIHLSRLWWFDVEDWGG